MNSEEAAALCFFLQANCLAWSLDWFSSVRILTTLRSRLCLFQIFCKINLNLRFWHETPFDLVSDAINALEYIAVLAKGVSIVAEFQQLAFIAIDLNAKVIPVEDFVAVVFVIHHVTIVALEIKRNSIKDA